jgi:PAS domain S-box-containing protein
VLGLAFGLTSAWVTNVVLGRYVSRTVSRLEQIASQITADESSTDLTFSILPKEFTTLTNTMRVWGRTIRVRQQEAIQANRNLEQQNHFQRTLLDAVDAPILYKNLDGTYALCNRAFARFFGKHPEDLIGQRAEDLYPAQILERIRGKEQRLLAGEELEPEEEIMQDLEGRTRTYMVVRRLVRDAFGTAQGFLATAIDLTPMQEADRAILSLLQSTADTLALDPYSGVAEGICRFLQADRGFVLFREQNCFRLVAAQPALPSSFSGLLVPPQECLGHLAQSRLICEHGSCQRWITESLGFSVHDALVIQAVANREGAIVGLIGAVSQRRMPLPSHGREILFILAALAGSGHHRLVVEEEQQRLQEQFHQAQKMEAIGRLAGSIAHDFNNLLCGMMGYAELIESKEENCSESREHARKLLSAAEHAAEITRRLLTWSRRDVLIFRPVHVHQVIHDVIALVSAGKDPRLDIQVQLKAQRSIVLGEAAHLESACINLAINAKDAMPHGGILSISTDEETVTQVRRTTEATILTPGDYLRLTISDTGSGIPREIQSRIFEPFFTTKQGDKGTGLGLPAVLGTVQSHRGAIAFESFEGKGTRFTLWLPLTAEQSLETSEETRDSAGNSLALKQHTILIIDDELEVREAASELLESLGYSALQASNGFEGLNLFSQHTQKIDAVLLDQSMPRMSGVEVFRKLRALNATLPIVLCSGYGNDQQIEHMLTQGPTWFLVKPFRLEHLDQVMKKALKEFSAS